MKKNGRNKINRKEVKMDKSNGYQNEDIIQAVGGIDTCCHP
jgi:hypothetical protein